MRNNTADNIINSEDVVMRQKSAGRARNNKDLSIIDEERLSRLEFEENERLMSLEAEKETTTQSLIPILNIKTQQVVQPVRTAAPRPHSILKPTAVKSILKSKHNGSKQLTLSHSRNQTDYNENTITEQQQHIDHSVTRVSSTAVNGDIRSAACINQGQSADAAEMRSSSSVGRSTAGESYNHQAGLEKLEQTIREADEAVRHSLMTSAPEEDNYHTPMHYVDIDIGEKPSSLHGDNSLLKSSVSHRDREECSVNTHHINTNIEPTSSPRPRVSHGSDRFSNKDALIKSPIYTATEPNCKKADYIDGHPISHHPHSNHVINNHPYVSADNTNYNHHSAAVTNYDPMTMSCPPEYFSRATPNSLPSPTTSSPEYRLVPSDQSPTGYVWTAHSLPLQSPSESPRHRLSQSGSPISPASGHQTIVYVPIITDNCKCCKHKSDPLRELVAHRRRSSARDDDNMSMASSIDSEVARYLVDYRSECGSNFDVMESRRSLTLGREDKIQKALLVNIYSLFWV